MTMMWLSQLRKLFLTSGSTKSKHRQPGGNRRRTRLRLEALENRLAPAVITAGLAVGDAIININSQQDGAAAYGGSTGSLQVIGTNQDDWYQPFNTSKNLLEYTFQPGTYTFRIINQSDAAAMFPSLTSTQLSEIGGAWTYNPAWVTDWLAFDSSATADPSEHQLFAGAVTPDAAVAGVNGFIANAGYQTPAEAYQAAIVGGYANQIVTGSGRYTGTTATSYTFTAAETLIFAVPDSALSDNAGTVSVLVSNVQAPAITSAASTAITVGTPGSFTVTATGSPTPSLSESGTLPTGVTFTDNGDGTATLGGTPVEGTAGSYPLTITAGNGVGSDATQNFTLTVNQAPAITSANSTAFLVRSSGSFTVQTTGSPAPTLSEAGALPAGVTFSDNRDGTATLGGKPAAGTSGAYSFTITASNDAGSTTQNFTLNVDQGAAITSGDITSTFIAGRSGSFTVRTSGFPAPTLSESGALPSGMTFVDNQDGTATISGTPAAGTIGTYGLTITAHNGVGSDATQNLTLSVSSSTNFVVYGRADGTIWKAALDGSYDVHIANGWSPRLSPDGLYLVAHESDLAHGSEFVEDLNTGTSTQIPDVGAEDYDINYTWTNDSSQIIYDDNISLLEVTRDGTNNHPLGLVGQAPDLAPPVYYGLLAYHNRDQGLLMISLVTSSAGEPGRLIPNTQPGDLWPTWSPDGQWISFERVFERVVNAGQGYQTYGTTGRNLYKIHLDGTGLTQLTFASDLTTQGFGPDSAWTADGNYLVAERTTATGQGLFLIAADGSGTMTPLATSNGAAIDFVGTVVGTINQTPPAITSGDTATFTVGSNGSFTVQSTGFPLPSLSETGALPAGVTFTDNHDGTATISGTPTGSAGTYTFTLTAHNGSSSDATQNFTLSVVAPVPVLSSLRTASATEGDAGFDLTVTGSGFSGSVLQWNGTALTTTFVSGTQLTAVIPTADLAEEGSATITVFNPSPGGGTSNALDFTITDPGVVATGTSIQALEGTRLTGVILATFTDPGGAEPSGSDPGVVADQYRVVSIDWGDSTPLDTTSGAISFSGTPGSITDTFTVTGSHTYAEENSGTGTTHTITVIISHESTSETASTGSPPVTVTSTVTWSDPAVLPVGGQTLSANVGVDTGSQVVATFTDPGGPEPNAGDDPGGLISNHYAATIDWGDPAKGTGTGTGGGTSSSPGTISFDPATGVFTVSGNHTYIQAGTFTITVNVSHEGVASAPVTSSALVQPLRITTVALASDHPAGAVYGAPVAFTATVSGSAGAGTPTGSVQFRIDGSNFGGPLALGGGTASVTAPALHAGSHTVVAFYTSDSSAFDNSDDSASPLSQAVAPAPLTITANDASKVYGAPLPALTASYNGFVNGDTSLVLSGSPSLTTTATASSAPATYSIVTGPGTLAAADYSFTFVNGTLTVTAAPLSATGVNINATAGAPFSGRVATFTNADPFGSATSYTATIAWGDGSTSAGTVSGTGTLTVTGSHTYASAVNETIHVTISHNLSYTTTAVTNSTATVGSLGLGVQKGQSASIGFWQGTNGQALIQSFNGGPNSTALSHWLATTFPHLYGASAGSHNLTGWTNAQVAGFYLSLFNGQVPKLDAQVLDTALDVYATTLSLGGTVAQAYGFAVTAYGLGASTYNVGTNGAAFGVANGTILSVYTLLKATDRFAVNGVLYNSNATLRKEALNVYSAINLLGGL
jgi:hypothetical protein